LEELRANRQFGKKRGPLKRRSLALKENGAPYNVYKKRRDKVRRGAPRFKALLTPQHRANSINFVEDSCKEKKKGSEHEKNGRVHSGTLRVKVRRQKRKRQRGERNRERKGPTRREEKSAQ